MAYYLPAGTLEGYTTPTVDRTPQKLRIAPRRVIPIVFLPGIMGSNLRMDDARQKALDLKHNVAWRPDNVMDTVPLYSADAATRQRRLDPRATAVDTYEPKLNPTGKDGETADDRHDNVNGSWIDYELDVAVSADLPLLIGDPITHPHGRTRQQKARERGWGEVYFTSYRKLLETCELRLNSAFFDGELAGEWRDVVGVDPATWQAVPGSGLKPLTEQELKSAVQGCWFPVHAMGYNWLQSNRDSADEIAVRIAELIDVYKNKRKFDCEKVIIVTHSMGGLVARALVHPGLGALQEKVLGVVHGVMPAIGAAATYKRMRCGFEDSWHGVSAKILGNYGDEVTAVLANSPGGLELLPSQAYGNDWLVIVQDGKEVKRLPKQGDPYEEIYKLQGKWYGLLREEWINPAKVKDHPVGYKQTCDLLDLAKKFHNDIASTYHPVSYAHYGADPAHLSWRCVVWELTNAKDVPDMEAAGVFNDDRQGKFQVAGGQQVPMNGGTPISHGNVSLRAAADPGDQTVPAYSADAQLRSGRFKGIFRQTGYDHQDSYKNQKALSSTLYSIVRIAQGMTWSKP